MGKVQHGEEAQRNEMLLHYYGSVDRSVLSLYMMVSEGIHWGDLMSPLMVISPWIQLPFYFITAFAIFAVLNVITGVFVELSINSANDDKRTFISAKVREVFSTVESDEEGPVEITFEDFAEHYLE